MLKTNKIDCTGCSACYNKCPKKAIEMVEDDKGFKYPIVDVNSCVKCDICNKVCPINDVPNVNFNQLAFGAKNKNVEERELSQSGGLFSVIAKKIIDKAGIVYGAILDNDVVKHVRASNFEEVAKMRGISVDALN